MDIAPHRHCGREVETFKIYMWSLIWPSQSRDIHCKGASHSKRNAFVRQLDSWQRSPSRCKTTYCRDKNFLKQKQPSHLAIPCLGALMERVPGAQGSVIFCSSFLFLHNTAEFVWSFSKHTLPSPTGHTSCEMRCANLHYFYVGVNP